MKKRQMNWMAKNDIAWDMSSVFPSVTDPSIDKTIDKLNEMASGLVANYQGKIEKLSAKGLLKLLQDYEDGSYQKYYEEMYNN